MMDLEGLLSELGGSGLFLCFAKWPVFSYASTTCCVIWKTFQPPRVETTATLTLCMYGGWGERGGSYSLFVKGCWECWFRGESSFVARGFLNHGRACFLS